MAHVINLILKKRVGGWGKRVSEHKRDFRNDMDYSALVVHAHATGRIPNWAGVSILAKCGDKGNPGPILRKNDCGGKM